MPKREEHCAFAVFNLHGRCVAICSHNRGPTDQDCTGRKDSDDESKPITDDQRREVRIG